MTALLASIGSTVIATYLQQFLFQLQFSSFPHHKLRVGDAPREARFRQLVVQLLCYAAVVLLSTRSHHLLLLLLQLLLLSFRQLATETARLRWCLVLTLTRHAQCGICRKLHQFKQTAEGVRSATNLIIFPGLSWVKNFYLHKIPINQDASNILHYYDTFHIEKLNIPRCAKYQDRIILIIDIIIKITECCHKLATSLKISPQSTILFPFFYNFLQTGPLVCICNAFWNDKTTKVAIFSAYWW